MGDGALSPLRLRTAVMSHSSYALRRPRQTWGDYKVDPESLGVTKGQLEALYSPFASGIVSRAT